MGSRKINYKTSGVDYAVLDDIKVSAQIAARKTANNLHGDFSEIKESRGESAYILKTGKTYLASVVEGLGTKNLVADAVKTSRKSYYDIIGHDTVATIVNDLVTVGASPLVINAYWAVGDSKWFLDKDRASDLINGWKKACDLAGASWGGGETPTLKGIVKKDTCDLGGSAVGIIKDKKNLITDKNLKDGDRIIFLKSNGINANGLSLAREIAKSLPKGYQTKVIKNKTYGELLLTKTNIYAKLISEILENKISIHYVSNITGHGIRKVMRSKRSFSYFVDVLFPVSPLFSFMQEKAKLSNKEAYGTWNMGQDYALFVNPNDVSKVQKNSQAERFRIY